MAKRTIPPESHSAQAFPSGFSHSFSGSALKTPSKPLLPSYRALSDLAFSQGSLSLLPRFKQFELQCATDIIIQTLTQSNIPCLLMLVGSYARGDWVEQLSDDGVNYHYQSHFDLLVVVKNDAIATKIERKKALHTRLKREVATPINLIAEDLYFINRRITQGQYFDVNESIVLHDTGAFELVKPQAFSPSAFKKRAEDDYVHWFNKAHKLMDIFNFCMTEQNYSDAVFQLHQVTECLYSAISLVFTRYKPKTHDLGRLSQRINSLEPPFLLVFPQGTQADKNKFELLRDAYVKARYKRDFKVTQDELEWLLARVLYLQTLTKTLCKAKIVSYGALSSIQNTHEASCL